MQSPYVLRRMLPPELIFKRVDQVLALPSSSFEARRSALPSIGGIYFVVVQHTYVVYVGITCTSMRQRWNSHHRAKDCLRFGDIAIHYRAWADDRPLYWAEQHAVQMLNPVLNWRPMGNIELVEIDGRLRFVAWADKYSRDGKCARWIFDDSHLPAKRRAKLPDA